jgi:hypothetical protein
LGDFDGDGRPDLVSGSNCCDPWTVHLFLRKADGTFAPRREIKFAPPPAERIGVVRGHYRPHLLDWNRDGRTDLVLDHSQSWKFQVGAGPLRDKSEVDVKSFPLPQLPDRNPYDFEFADWDGDGLVDVLMAGAYLKTEKGPWLYDIYWLRNVSPRGEPKFEPPVRLLTAPAQSMGWQFDGYAVVDRGRAGRQDLVVSVSKNWQRNPKGGWSNNSQLLLYRRKG